nr:response regulator [Clostridium caldaquaticum]
MKVIIADDERRVCNLILNIVPWAELGYNVIATVNNGLDAFNMICEHKPDVVITDARMPGYDGIELIKHTRENNLNPVFIIISGYKYFEYAYNALQYGVEYYLLKPINKTELCDALTKIRKSKMEQIEKLNDNSNILNQIAMTKETMRRHFIKNHIFDGRNFKTSSIESLEEINREYQMVFKEGYYQAIYIKIDTIMQNQTNNQVVLDLVSAKVSNSLEACCTEYVYAVAKSGVIALVNYSIEDKQKFEAAIEKLNENLKDIVDKFNCFKVTIGLSIAETDFNNIPDCIKAAVEAVKYRIILLNKEIIDYNKHKFKKLNIKHILTAERKEQLKSYFESNEQDNCRRLIDTCISEIYSEKDYNPSALYELYEVIGETLLQYVNDVGVNKAPYEDIQKKYDDFIDNAYSEETFIETLHSFIMSALSCIYNEKEFQDTKPIRMAKQYIQEHFAEDISLEIVAREIHLSSSYLSTIFRKETGLNFSEYLINCRIEEAKKLLKKTNKSMAEISEKIGYSDVKYFSKLFNKKVGLKPSEYRKLYS